MHHSETTKPITMLHPNKTTSKIHKPSGIPRKKRKTVAIFDVTIDFGAQLSSAEAKEFSIKLEFLECSVAGAKDSGA